MKKKYIIPGLLAAVAAVGLTSCDEEIQSLLSDLEVTGYTQEFKVGDQFSQGDLKVEAKYSDDKVVDVTNEVEIKAPESLSTPGTYAVIISYKGLSEAYQITVKDSSSTQGTLKNLIVSGAKNSFVVGEAFATTGLKVEAKYSDDKVVDVTKDAEIKAPESLSASGTYAVVVSYGGLSTSYQVTVANEVLGVADAVKLGVANASKINGGVATFVSGEKVEPGTYTTYETHQTYVYGENYLQVKDYSAYAGRYSYIYHYFLASNDKIYGASEYYDENSKKYVLESMDTSAKGADALNGIELYGPDSKPVYGSAAYVKALYDFAVKNENGDFKEAVVDDTYTFEVGMYEEESGSFYKVNVFFELSAEKSFKNIEVLLTAWDNPEDYQEDETTHHYSLTDKAAIHGSMYQQYIFDETIGAREYETQYTEENYISESFTIKDSKGADVADGATVDAELSKDTTLSYTSSNKLISPIVDKPELKCESFNVYAYYSDPTQDSYPVAGSVDDTVAGKLTFTDWDNEQTVFTILENGDLKDAEDHTYVKQNKDNQSVYDTYIYTAEDGTYIKFNYTDDPYMDTTLTYSGDGKIHIMPYCSGTYTLKIETILDEVTITINVPYMNPDSMGAKEFIPNEDNPTQAAYAAEESSSMKTLVNDSLYFVGVPKYKYNAANALSTEFKAEIVSDNKADATLELVECSYQDGKIKAYQFKSTKLGTYEVKITSTIEGCEAISTTITIDVVDVSNVKLTDLVNGYYEGSSNYLQSFNIEFKPASSDALNGVAYVGFSDYYNNKYANTFNYVINADAKTVTLTENGDKKTATLTLNLNKFMEMSLSLGYEGSQYNISLTASEAPDLSTYYADYKNVENEDTISISADGVTATLDGQPYTTTSAMVVGNYIFINFENLSLVLTSEYGMLTDSVYGIFNVVVHEDPLAEYYGTYTNDDGTSTLKLSAVGYTYDGFTYKLKSFDGSTFVLIDDTGYECTLEIRSDGIYDVANDVLLIKQAAVDPLAPYYGTYINDDGSSTLKLSVDGYTYDGFTYKLKSFDGSTFVLIDDTGYECTLEIRSDGIYDVANGVLLMKVGK